VYALHVEAHDDLRERHRELPAPREKLRITSASGLPVTSMVTSPQPDEIHYAIRARARRSVAPTNLF
jgi:hypothetical protein